MEWDDLLLLVKREMLFGRYKVTLMVELSGNHLVWFARLGFLSGKIGCLRELMHFINHDVFNVAVRSNSKGCYGIGRR